MEQLVINLQYSTGNVNQILYASQDLPSSLVISKDAESIILQCSALGILGESVTSFLTITWDQSRTRFHKTSTIVKTAFWISLDTQTGANKLHATYSNYLLFLETKITGTTTDSIDKLNISSYIKYNPSVWTLVESIFL